MKVFLAFLLIFSVYLDFGTVCAGEDLSVGEEMTTEHCQGHNSTEASHSDEATHCHCELGHLHSACHTFSVTSVMIDSFEFLSSFPDIMVSAPQNTHHEIIRPPISA